MFLKHFEFYIIFLTLVNHMHEIMCQYERHTFSFKAEFLFEMAQDVTEIYVEELK